MLRLASLMPLALVLACAPAESAPTVDPRIERVINGLRPELAIAGEAPVRWTLAERMSHYKVPGLSVAVIDSGRIVWARGFGVTEAGGSDSVTTGTLFQAGSISKPTFALGLMSLVQEGRISLDADVNDLLTSWKVPANRFTAAEKVTLRRILSHNAGLTVHGFPGYEAGTPVPTVVQVLNGEKPANTPPVRVDTFPGAISRYSGGGTTVAQLLVTDVTGTPFPDFMKARVLEPAGMTNSTYEQPLPPAMAARAATGTLRDGTSVPGRFHTYPEMAAAGLWTTASDLATLAIELQHTWAGLDAHVVNRTTLAEMFTVQKAPFGIGYMIDGSGGDLSFEHNGADEGFQAQFVAFAERGQGFVAMANSDNGISLMNEVMMAVAEEYGWPSHRPKVRTPVALDPARAAAIAGTYTASEGGQTMTVKVANEDGRLYIDFPPAGLAHTELLADSDTSLFVRTSGLAVVPKRNPAGVVTGLDLASGRLVVTRSK